MARNLKREYELSKKRENTQVSLATKIPKTLSQDFAVKVELEGITKSAKIKEFIEQYTYGEINRQTKP